MDLSDEFTTRIPDLDRHYESFLQEYANPGTQHQLRRQSLFGANTGLPKPKFDGAPPQKRTRKTDSDDSLPPTPATKKNDEEMKQKTMELVQSRTEAAMMRSHVNRLERQLAESKAQWDRQQLQAEQANKKLEAKLFKLEHELHSSKCKENLPKSEESKDFVVSERHRLTEELGTLRKERRESLERISEVENSSDARIRDLSKRLMDEERKCKELSLELEQASAEKQQLSDRNRKIMDDWQNARKDSLAAQDRAKEAEQKLDQYKDECKMAMAVRDEFHKFQQLQKDLETSKIQCQKYKLQCENTAMLKEECYSLREELKRLNERYHNAVDENNRLKLHISTQSPTGEPGNSTSGKISRLATIDDLSKELGKYADENDQLRTLLKESETEKMQLQRTLETKEIETTERIEDLDELLGQKEEALQKANGELADAQNECKSIEKQFLALQSRLDEANQNMGALKSQLTERDNRIDELQAQQKEFILPSTGESSSPAEVKELEAKIVEKDEEIKYLREKLQGDFDGAKTKILHMEFNPLDEAHREMKNELETLQKDNERMKVRLEEFETERQDRKDQELEEEDLTTRVQIRLSEQEHKKQVEGLENTIQQMNKENQKRITRIQEMHNKMVREFRETSARLTGYEIKMHGDEYCIKSMFETHPDNVFLIKKDSSNVLHLMDTEYSEKWRDFVEEYLESDNCYPAFLAAATLQLYNKNETTLDAQDSTVAAEDSTTS